MSKEVDEEKFSPLQDYFKKQQENMPNVEEIGEIFETKAEKYNPWIKPMITNPWIILLLNLIQPGLGHILMGQINKGIGIIIISLISDFFVIGLCFILIGFFLIPFLFFFDFFIILYDGWMISKRLENGYPVMHGECSTKYIKYFGLNYFIDPLFVNSNENECPIEWKDKMHEIKQYNELIRIENQIDNQNENLI